MMLPFVVVPVLNEEVSLEATCRSLGFGNGLRDPEAVLVLVDNGSTDSSVAIAERIKASSRSGRVLLAREQERGFVPARVAGVHVVAEHGRRLGLSPDRTLVLQADADTIYHEGYVAAMVSVACEKGRGFLYEGASVPPDPDVDACRGFRELEVSIDGDFPCVASEIDVVVDDKVVAYVLSDYLAWGGHRREYDDGDEEWLAETTRLFIRSRLTAAAQRVGVEGATATTSSRRILEDPALAFATAGFPRGGAWRRNWDANYHGSRSLAAFSIGRAAEVENAIAMRRRHLAALFRFLPEIVANQLEPAEHLEGLRAARKHGVRLVQIDDAETLSPGGMLGVAFERAAIDR